MQLNTNIPLGVKGLELENPANMMMAAQRIRSGQEESRMNAMRIDEYERGRMEEDAVRNMFARPGADIDSPDFTREMYGVSPKSAGAFQKSRTDLMKARTEEQARRMKLATDKLAMYQNVLPEIKSPEQLAQWYTAQAGDPDLKDTPVSQHPLEQKLAGIPSDPAAFQEHMAKVSMGLGKWLDANKPQNIPQDLGDARRVLSVPGMGGDATVVPGSEGDVVKRPILLTPEEEAQKARIAQAGRSTNTTVNQPEKGAPVAVVDPATNRPVLVSRADAIAGRMTPAASVEGLTPKERQLREAKFPQATAAVKSVESVTAEMTSDMQKLLDHPGLDSITGIVAGRLPGVTGPGREAQALYDKVMARGGFQELAAMRQASPTGGALGNVSNTEGAQLKAAFAAIDRRQNAPSVRRALNQAIERAREMGMRTREAYETTYEYRTASPQSAAPGVDADNPLLR